MTWLEILEDPNVARLEFRVESDCWGNLVMSPPPNFNAEGSLEQSVLCPEFPPTITVD